MARVALQESGVWPRTDAIGAKARVRSKSDELFGLQPDGRVPKAQAMSATASCERRAGITPVHHFKFTNTRRFKVMTAPKRLY